ncbi:MAG: T9SS type A sorting domain-containing protein [Bacteroidales bacterium]|nr:T9SS type A sorting domain-containing protein [Bacteroidales bacterium]HOI31429.1 T9SS type A sorting domain-containing protein [Bacteroidales bacterium]
MKKKITFNFLVTTMFLMTALLVQNSLQAQFNNPQTDLRLLQETAVQPTKTNDLLPNQKIVAGSATLTVLVNDYLFPYDISTNGDYVAIAGFGEGGFYWSQEEGLIPVSGTTYGISDDGLITGTFQNPDYQYQGTNVNTAGTWSTVSNDWTFLGINPNHPEILQPDYNSAWGIDASGETVVGMQYYDGFSYTTFKWTSTGGYEMIGDPASAGSRPNGISRVGEVIYGWADINNTSRSPIIWANGTFNYVDPNNYGEAFAASYDGTFVTGTIGDNVFIWENGGETITFSNELNTGVISPTCIMEDATVLGYTNESWPPFPDSRRAFVRNPDGTMETFNDYAEARGMADAQSWIFYSINDVTPDGNKFIGAGQDTNGNWATFILDFGGSTVTYALDLEANPEEGGTVLGAGIYEAGSLVSINAVAETGYSFINWTDEAQTVISEEAAFDFEMPENDILLTANFEEITYALALITNPENAGEVTGAGDYAAGETVNIEAVPAIDFAFVNWTDENETIVSEEASFSFTMPDNDYVLTANFTTTVGLAEQQMLLKLLYPNPTSDYLNLELTQIAESIKIINTLGQVVYENNSSEFKQKIDVSKYKSGMYQLIIISTNNTQTKSIYIY